MTSFLRATVVGGVLLAASLASAEPTRNIELSVFDPTPATTGSLFQVQSADVGEDGDYAAGAFATYASKPLVTTTDAGVFTVIRHQTKLILGGAYAFGGRYEGGVRLPVYLQSGDAIPEGTTGVAPAEGAAVGDLTAHIKAQLAGGGPARFGVGLGLTLPTARLVGDEKFVGVNLPSARVLGLLSVAAGPLLTFHLNAGGVLRQTSQFGNVEQGSGLSWGAGASFRLLEKLFIDGQMFGDYLPGASHGRSTAMDLMGPAKALMTFEWLAGGHFVMSPQMSIGFAGGRGLTGGLGEPAFRGMITFAYTPGGKALPPLHKPPPPIKVDPNVDDTDYDKIVDAKDKCPKEGEDKDGFEDEDGCPEPDNDKDGVLDVKDKCPLVAEDKDGFADTDGCPDPDNDKDGIEDGKDKCPDKAEKINGNDDDDGCPDNGDSLVISNPDRLEMLEPVLFKGDEIDPESINALNQLAATLRARADIKRLRIGVHVQPTKVPKKDQALSDRRATAVQLYLVKRGIAAERIEVKGFGSKTPLIDPGKKGSEMINNRIELIILERSQ